MIEESKLVEIDNFRSLIDGISCRCRQDPQGKAFVFLNEDMQAQEVSNEQFYYDVQRYAQGLIAKGIKSGEIVLLALDHGYELLCCFWGTICCGAIPSILTYWYSGSDVDVYARKVKNLAEAVQARAVIGQPDLHSAISVVLGKTNCLVFANQEITAVASVSSSALPELNGEQIAIMQFTSGTTGKPKAIRFSHRAILDHVKMISETNGIPPDWVNVSWLPFYHDMGLIMHIRALVNGNIVVSISPQIWLRKPELLFRAVSRYGNAVVNMPNFAFEYCLKRIKDEDLAGLDLSGWKILSNGSEPVKVDSMERFYQKFAPYGFRRDALKVSYGMAENIAAVSMTPSGRMPHADWVSMAELYTQKKAIPVNPESPGAKAIASCGYPYPGVELAIVDQEWKMLADREVGEIIIRSDTLFDGYYLAEKNAENSFRDGWFRTGDIGYMVDGELFVCDRKKDLIIVGGRNIHPQAIENIAADVFGPLAARCAAFGVSDQTLGTELPVLLVEQRKQIEDAERQNLIKEVRKQVLEELDVTISDVHLVPKGWVIKTTSGKVARAANREKYLSEIKSDADEQDTISADELIPEQVKDNLINLFEKVLGITGIGEKDNFFILGGDSLSALRMLLSIERVFGHEISAEEFFQEPTIKYLTNSICKKSTNKAVMEIDMPYRCRRKGSINYRKSGRLPILFIDRLYELKRNIKQKITNTIPTWLFEHKWIKYLLILRQIRLMKQFYKLLEAPLQTEEEFCQCELICYVPHLIRKKLNTRPFANRLKQWSVQVDMDTLELAYKKGNGVVMVCWHAHSWLIRLVIEFMLERINPKTYSYVGRLKEFLPKDINERPEDEKRFIRMTSYLDQLVKAKKTLMQGEIVFMLPDGYQGISSGFSIPFHGRSRTFRAGFAELTMETGAAIIPISLNIDIRKRKLSISSLTPFKIFSTDMSYKERNEELVMQYAAFLKQQWAEYPGLITFGQMRKYIRSIPVSLSCK